MHIRDAGSDDGAAIAALIERAFGREAESKIIERLDADDDTVLSLVADRDGDIVGHIQFYRIQSEAGDMVGLGPMSVDPDSQKQGIGSALVRNGIEHLQGRGDHSVLFVLGHTDYYPRFGFSAERARDFTSPYSGEPFGDAFMAMDLNSGAPRASQLTFPSAFS